VPERDVQRVGLRLWQRADCVHHRSAELVKARVGEVDLTFDTDGANDLEPRGRGTELIEQRRLADSGLAVHHERGAPTTSHSPQQFLEPRKLMFSAHERAQSGGRQLLCRPD
jgi:hypothetical protein